MNKTPEILAPCGSLQALDAALAAGADAVYLAGKKFGARAYAKNFEDDEIEDAVAKAHLTGVKVYAAMNTLVSDREIESALEYARFLCQIGIDALIVQDVGLAALIREAAPKLRLHGSTQMAVHNLEGAKKAAELGLERIVLARELPLSEISNISKNCGIETEVFVHGSLCFSHSGQCLMSAVIGRRSANRGRCAGPCRLPYSFAGREKRYQLSLKDLYLADRLRELCKAGVSSLKIEGRMKRPEYVCAVTAVYKKALTSGERPRKDEKERLAAIFSRSGFTSGYFDGQTGRDMFGMRDETVQEKYERLLETERGRYANAKFDFVKRRAAMSATVKAGQRVSVRAEVDGRTFEAFGAPPEKAITRSTGPQDVVRQLKKSGGTCFEVIGAEAEVEDGLSVPLSVINALRREVLEKAASSAGRAPADFCRAQAAAPENIIQTEREIYAQYSHPGQLPDVPTEAAVSFLPLLEADDGYFEKVRAIGERGIALGVTLPRVLFDSERETYKKLLQKYRECGAQYAMISNIGQIDSAIEAGFAPIGDIGLNIFNSHSLERFKRMGLTKAVLSPELSFPQIRDIAKPLPAGIFAYGRLPLMVSENCLSKNEIGCAGRCRLPAELVDRQGQSFRVAREFGCRNIIQNGKKVFLADKSELYAGLNLGFLVLSFTDESPVECAQIIAQYACGNGVKPENFTRGLYTRGVE